MDAQMASVVVVIGDESEDRWLMPRCPELLIQQLFYWKNIRDEKKIR
jgi:hypothetical protein